MVVPTGPAGWLAVWFVDPNGEPIEGVAPKTDPPKGVVLPKVVLLNDVFPNMLELFETTIYFWLKFH